MDDRFHLEKRLAALERSVLDTDRSVAELESLAAVIDELEALANAQTTLERRLATIEGDLAAVRGCIDTLVAEETAADDRAERALVHVERLEQRIDTIAGTPAVDRAPSPPRGQDTLASQLFATRADPVLSPPPEDSPFLDEGGHLTLDSTDESPASPGLES